MGIRLKSCPFCGGRARRLPADFHDSDSELNAADAMRLFVERRRGRSACL
jgi:hypothetical protein